MDILQEEEGGKTVIVILQTDTQAGEEEKKKKRSPTVSHLGPVETQSLSTMGQVLERIELKLLGSWCNWTTSPPTTRLQHPESSLRFGRVTTDDQHTAPGSL